MTTILILNSVENRLQPAVKKFGFLAARLSHPSLIGNKSIVYI